MKSSATFGRHLSKFEKRAKMPPPTAVSYFTIAAFSLPRQLYLVLNIPETTWDSNFKIYQNVALDSRSLHLDRKQSHQLLSVGRKSHKRVHFVPCSGRDCSITVQSISKRLTVLERVIQGFIFHCVMSCIRHFAPWPRTWRSRGLTVIYALHKWLI